MRRRFSRRRSGRLPTPCFFYGMTVGEQILAEIEKGKVLNIVLVAIGEVNAKGERKLFFELNGQPRTISVIERAASANIADVRMADENDPSHIAAPMPGLISALCVKPGDLVRAGDRLMSIEAMKMETAILASSDGKVSEIPIKVGELIDAKQLLCVISA